MDIYFDRITVGTNGVLEGTGDYFSFVINSTELSGEYELSESTVSVTAIEDYNPAQPDNAVVKFPSRASLTVEGNYSEITKVSYSITYGGIEYRGETSTNISEF
ncbi:hypothetical protein [Mangrovivirga cuniculi]|uniref:Uncharacterized protein n=1 Tax=Mangrovivirga cuniculi TaxID=2715131 RepID=A0A4D7JL69_9BACT|nr:hypothetical protein [Mangrovivirga cuniculi]QCK16351.1 hypothetical protein DCC35_17220 [Mangrovivirga cuniculi]